MKQEARLPDHFVKVVWKSSRGDIGDGHKRLVNCPIHSHASKSTQEGLEAQASEMTETRNGVP